MLDCCRGCGRSSSSLLRFAVVGVVVVNSSRNPAPLVRVSFPTILFGVSGVVLSFFGRAAPDTSSKSFRSITAGHS